MAQKKRKKGFSTAAHNHYSLDWFLQKDDMGEDDDALSAIARRLNEQPFNVDAFRTELELRIIKYSYSAGSDSASDRTYHQILTDAGLLQSFYDPETLRQLWQCRLLVTIAKEFREFEKQQQTIDGQTVSKVRKRIRQLESDARK